ncbi:MAG: PaaI family thioesterase [Candidatus Promineifilaceae bacterium]
MEAPRAIQDAYADDVSHCYGCGQLNEHGLHIRSYWQGDEVVCHFKPAPYHTVMPGYVYGGLIAALIDCHSAAAAAAGAARAAGREPDEGELDRYVTASLRVDYLRPTPLGETLVLTARVRAITSRKLVVATSLAAAGQERARGEAVLVRMPEGWAKGAEGA